MAEEIEAWTTNNGLRLAITPSDSLMLVEHEHNEEAYVTVLMDTEPLELPGFLIKH